MRVSASSIEVSEDMMVTRRLIIVLALLLGAIVLGPGCSKEDTAGPEKQQNGATAPNAGLVHFVKNNKLGNFPSRTIGDAFDSYSYLTNKTWSTEQVKGGYFTVHFSGWLEPGARGKKALPEGVTGRGLEVIFVVNLDGSFYLFMMSAFESRADGRIYRNQLPDNGAVLNNIYANKKIEL